MAEKWKPDNTEDDEFDLQNQLFELTSFYSEQERQEYDKDNYYISSLFDEDDLSSFEDLDDPDGDLSGT